VFQKELSNFGSLYKFIHMPSTVFLTVIMKQNTWSFTWNSYGSMQGVLKKSFTTLEGYINLFRGHVQCFELP
jgi:hypothetical protein